MKYRRFLKITSIALAAILFILVGAVIFYAADYYRAGDAAKTLASDPAQVTVLRNGYALGNPEAEVGLIFYPGGKVEHTAYLPLLQMISEQGIFCYVVRMPLNLAVFKVNAADAIIKRYPNVSSWMIGGHSLGGAMAASYAEKHQDTIDGLILLAAYTTADLSESPFGVLSVYGSQDKVLNQDNLVAGRDLVPDDYQEIVIEGGNHAQFGDYGPQAGDGQALISATAQWEQTAAVILKFMNARNSAP
ncbi:MAG TPA: alpha/beta hydrolase [Clostridiales bacterium]|nr:alpha/beta hydrolase [Clostridiales bacterium]